eukprot:GHVQ01007549.1.p1 GENE.GHVQ01007549.1~~GHVQ01007549.1.p1  ORF type:complete len:377 (+),score=25.72 GHVQ01007549.1:497-1627(+)
MSSLHFTDRFDSIDRCHRAVKSRTQERLDQVQQAVWSELDKRLTKRRQQMMDRMAPKVVQGSAAVPAIDPGTADSSDIVQDIIDHVSAAATKRPGGTSYILKATVAPTDTTQTASEALTKEMSSHIELFRAHARELADAIQPAIPGMNRRALEHAIRPLESKIKQFIIEMTSHFVAVDHNDDTNNSDLFQGAAMPTYSAAGYAPKLYPEESKLDSWSSTSSYDNDDTNNDEGTASDLVQGAAVALHVNLLQLRFAYSEVVGMLLANVNGISMDDPLVIHIHESMKKFGDDNQMKKKLPGCDPVLYPDESKLNIDIGPILSSFQDAARAVAASCGRNHRTPEDVVAYYAVQNFCNVVDRGLEQVDSEWKTLAQVRAN